jgi:hypothetical protein
MTKISIMIGSRRASIGPLKLDNPLVPLWNGWRTFKHPNSYVISGANWLCDVQGQLTAPETAPDT